MPPLTESKLGSSISTRSRSGNAGASQGAAQFLSEALSLLGAQHRIRCVRADSGFYADQFLSFLEERALPYIVVARLTSYLKSRLYQLTEWQAIEVFTCGAILGRSGHHLVLHMSKNWGGYSSRKPLFNNLLHWPRSTSPKFDLPKENAA